MNALCPISPKKIPGSLSRWVALIALLMLIGFFLTGWVLLPAILSIDFLLRASDRSSYSPFAQLGRLVMQLYPQGKKLTNAGPKIFAARIGLVFSSGILIFSLAGFTQNALILTVILATFSFLEAFLGFCMACLIYPVVYKLVYRTSYS